LINRILEILPAFLAWTTIFLPVVLSFHFPVLVATFIVIFASMWFVRAIEFSLFLILSFLKFKKAQKINWIKKNKNFSLNKNLTKKEKENRNNMINENKFIKPEEVIHLVIIPTYKEGIEVLRDSVKAILKSNFDLKKIFLCIATEERDKINGKKNAALIAKEFKNKFGKFFHFTHPDKIPGEIRGKGGNITYAGKNCTKILQKENFDLKKIIVTTLDADNCVHQDYFAALTYSFCTEKNRHYRSFQPLAFFFNNIWDVPVFNRIVALSSSFWHMIENGRPDRLRNFASHAQPLSALKEMNFWSVKTIVEDGHQYWRSYLHFKGNYAVVPVFIPIFFDAFQDKNFFRSVKGQFLQLRRWAWGVNDIPFMIKNWWKMKKQLPFFRTLLQFFRLCEGHFMWATAPILITLTTPIPRMINDEFSETVFAANSAFLVSHTFSFALTGIIIAMGVSFLLMPRPKTIGQKISIFGQWLLLPFVTVIFGSSSALTAQTILASGRKLEFNVTPKIRIIKDE